MTLLRLAVALLIGSTLAVVGVPSPVSAQEEAMPMAQEASSVTVEAVLARDVVDRMPVDSGAAFPAEVGTITLWTRVSGAAGQTLHHVWFYGDEQVGDVELAIGGSPWRTWSRKTVPAAATGAWHVEIRDAAGAVLQRIDFTVGQ